MFNLKQAIGQWREALKAQPSFRDSDLDELEDHLMTEITELTGNGLTEEEAFIVASRRLGKPEDLNGEFAIADPVRRRKFRLTWMVIGALALIFLWVASEVITNFGTGAMFRLPGGDFVPVGPMGMGWRVGFFKLLFLGLGAVLIWRLMATDHSSRRLRSMGGWSVLAISFLLAFLVLVARMGAKVFSVHAIPQSEFVSLSVASAWINSILLFLLPAILLVGLWRLVRR